MKKLLLCIAVAVAANVMTPATAHANIGWWDYLEQMSGPGPFDRRGPLGIFTVDTAVACRVAAAADGRPQAASSQGNTQGEGSRWIFLNSADCLLDPTRRGPRRVTDFISLRLGATATDGNRPLFSDRSEELLGKVTAWTIDAKFTRRLDAAIELAAGGGVIFFTGDTLDSHVPRATVTPISVTLTPIGLFHRNSPQKFDGLVGLRFEEIGILGDIEAKDFNQRSTSSFRSDNIDLVRRFTITVDISPFVFPRSR